MDLSDKKPEPIRIEWKSCNGEFENREMLGKQSFFFQHCGVRMKRILHFNRTNHFVEAKKQKTNMLFCEVCEKRHVESSD